MTRLRRLARGLLRAAVKHLAKDSGADVRDWGRAMLAEMDSIEGDWAALAWSLGSVKSAITMKGRQVMRGQQINRVSSRLAGALCLIALATVLSGYLHPAHHPEQDEGAEAHIFQISIVLLAPTLLFFLASADWKHPLRSVRTLAIPAAALVLAFAALYYLEHYYLAPL